MKPSRWRLSRWAIVIVAAIIVLLTLWLWPALNRGRYSANRVKCAANLRAIGLACIMYANADPQGRFPDTFEHLMAAQDFTPEVFCCPASDDHPSRDAAQLSAGGHLSYIYVGNGLTKKLGNEGSSSLVIAFEALKNHQNSGMDVVFADGRVEWLDAEKGKTLQAFAKSVRGRMIRWDGKTATVAATQP
ncbi:MAG TPA: hypothetical protein VG269_19810 [Tepidisphaeraceae bacterium]|nr:hypothetical protein [Tepidisphaeraceae bacterium]